MLKTIFVLVGSFVGAGFASGREIYNFFTIYQYNSFFSITLFCFLLFLLIYKCLNAKYSLHIDDYGEFIAYLEKKYKFLNSRIFTYVINIFLASSFYIMVIALSSLFNYQFNIAKWITIIITIFICYVIFYKKNINFVYIINSILMPILIIFIISLCLLNINLENIQFTTSNNFIIFFKDIFMGLLYFSYNSLLLIPIIFDLKLIKNKKMNLNVSFFFSLIIFIITFLVNLLLLSFYNNISNIELPILYISNNSFFFFSYFYFFVILSAIFTTMISCGYSFINNFNKKHFHKKLILFLFLSFIFCMFSFSTLINFFYPLFGLIGLIQIFLIFIDKT